VEQGAREVGDDVHEAIMLICCSIESTATLANTTYIGLVLQSELRPHFDFDRGDTLRRLPEAFDALTPVISALFAYRVLDGTEFERSTVPGLPFSAAKAASVVKIQARTSNADNCFICFPSLPVVSPRQDN
jgi:hypothetical protein